MRKARGNDHIVFNGATIMLFQDLSQITLKNRRALRPLLDKLRERDMRYSWKFPFALSVTSGGRQPTLRDPDGLRDFCAALELDYVSLPDWYAEFLGPQPESSPLRSPFSTPEKRFHKRLKPHRMDGSKAGTPRTSRDDRRERGDD